MLFGITDLTTYLIGTILIILLPGPNSIYVMTTASRYGKPAGYQAALGVLVGDTILMLLTVIGAASLLRTVPALFLGLKIIGALYLGWIAIQLLRAGYQTWITRHDPTQADTADIKNAGNPFKRALSISLLNPKAILFFVSFFIQFVDPSYPHPALSFLILGILLQIMSFAYLSSLIVAGTKLAGFFSHHRILSAFGIGLIGILFLGFSAKLVVSTI